MLSRRIGWISAGCALSFMSLGILGCGSNNSLGPGANTTSKERVFNGLIGGPGNGTVDVFQRNVAIDQPAVPFGGVSSYVTVAAGNGVDTNVYLGGTSASPLAPVNSVNLSPNTNYTIGVVGISGQTTGPTRTQIIQYTDTPPNLTGNANAEVRIINALPNSPTGGISLYNGASNTVITGFSNIAYPNDSGYQGIPAGSYSLVARDNAGNTIATAAGATLAAGHAYTLVLTGQGNGGAPASKLTGVQDQ